MTTISNDFRGVINSLSFGIEYKFVESSFFGKTLGLFAKHECTLP